MCEGLLGGGDQLGPPLPHAPLVLRLLVEPLVVTQLLLTHAVDGGAHAAHVRLGKSGTLQEMFYFIFIMFK